MEAAPIVPEEGVEADAAQLCERLRDHYCIRLFLVRLFSVEEPQGSREAMTEEHLARGPVDDFRLYRLRLHKHFGNYEGKMLQEWPNELVQKSLTNAHIHRSLPVTYVRKYPFLDQKEFFNFAIHTLWSMFCWQEISTGIPERIGASWKLAGYFLWNGKTWTQRSLLPVLLVLFEVLLPIFWIITLLLTVLTRGLVQTGFRFHFLSLANFLVCGRGMYGKEPLPPGENGYTKTFQGGDDVDLDELEGELMERNAIDEDDSSHNHEDHVNTICISYKHYANRGKVPGDDHRICRTDLYAIAQFIHAAAPCKLRFWIDTKLPPTTDDTLERWLNRGVRPYGRYMTFLCPSARKYAETSFWLHNEYHFAASAKGAIHFEGRKLYSELRHGYIVELHRRFLHVLIEAERHPVQVRDQDKGKVIHWAMCCLRSEGRGFQMTLSPSIDRLTMVGRHPHRQILLGNISKVIRTLGAQELPVVPGRSWNKDNPLLLDGVPDQQLDLSNWYGLCIDESPKTIYFLHETSLADIQYETVVVLEVTLEKERFTSGKIRVTSKVLKELSSSIILRCKFVALPWLCDWE